jgi:hypothetical protein
MLEIVVTNLPYLIGFTVSIGTMLWLRRRRDKMRKWNAKTIFEKYPELKYWEKGDTVASTSYSPSIYGYFLSIDPQGMCYVKEMALDKIKKVPCTELRNDSLRTRIYSQEIEKNEKFMAPLVTFHKEVRSIADEMNESDINKLNGSL